MVFRILTWFVVRTTRCKQDCSKAAWHCRISTLMVQLFVCLQVGNKVNKLEIWTLTTAMWLCLALQGYKLISRQLRVENLTYNHSVVWTISNYTVVTVVERCKISCFFNRACARTAGMGAWPAPMFASAVERQRINNIITDHCHQNKGIYASKKLYNGQLIPWLAGCGSDISRVIKLPTIFTRTFSFADAFFGTSYVIQKMALSFEKNI